MNSDKILKEGLTFDDVLLVPARSHIHPQKVSLKTNLTRKITLNIPIVSAAMDTVTEAAMAIALAREGGIGIIHKNLSIADQAEQVGRVKRSESGMITNPVTISGDHLVSEAVAFCRRAGCRRVWLTTFAGLDAARRLYEEAGFRLMEEREDAHWGKTVPEQTFELLL